MAAKQPTKGALKRLARDVRALIGDTLADHGIYYRHSESDILRGQAIIIGGEGTVYQWGCYVFDFQYPPDYPHSPPVATFRTVDQRHRTRFNPNCYRNGKVCLSVLNTWQGEQWTGCQTISSVLLAIKASVFAVPEPLLNEPGVGRGHPDFGAYHDILRFKNLEVAIWGAVLDVAEARAIIVPELRFVVARVFLSNEADLLGSLRERANNVPATVVKTSIYDMTVPIDYGRLLGDIEVRAADVREALKTLAREAEIDV